MSLCVGEGGSGGAMAFSHTDALWMLDDAFYSVIAPEAAATILWRDADRADEVAGQLALTAHQLLDLGIVDAVIRATAGRTAITKMIEQQVRRPQFGSRSSRLDLVSATAIAERVATVLPRTAHDE
jgi:acetyl-CoA carboxylase alpha subunit